MILRLRALRSLLVFGVAVVAVVALISAGTVLARPASSGAAGPDRGLRFGIYPWGTVGTIDPVSDARPEVPQQTLAAVRTLRGSKAFVVHLYGEYTGTDRGAAGRLLDDARWWSAHGLQVEMVLRYRPARPELSAAFPSWVRWVALRLAKIRGVTAIQVGNEANLTTAPDAADGAYPGAIRAIARAVPAARNAIVSKRRRDIGIGINWAAGARPCTTGRFWPALHRAGGRRFTSAVSWVGIDVYPGTWSGTSRAEHPTAADVDTTMTDTIRCVRTKHLRAAGLGRRVRLTVAETGYPTDPSRPESTQQAVLAATVATVQRVRATYGVTDLRWFSLRDANTASGQLENGYGLLRDDGSEKPAFGTYRDLVAGVGR